MREESLPFFRVLAGSKPSENYLSRAFQACFTQSPVFANAALSLLWRTCKIKGEVPDAGNWVCDYQPAMPDGGKIRPDLCLRSVSDPNQSRTYKPIFIESKVGAALGERQLKNYIDSGAEILVAITKNWPEVSRARLSRLGVNHLRWQEVSRALFELSSHKGKDRFLCEAFVEFLEYSSMSYREDITISHLEDVRKLLAKLGAPCPHGFVPNSGFDLADSCLALLLDARRIVQEETPNLKKFKNWGPGYFNVPCEDEDSPNGIEMHAIGMSIFRKGQHNKNKLLCALYFSVSEPNRINWIIENIGSEIKQARGISMPIEDLITKGKLDANKLAQSIGSALKKWKLFW